MKKELQENEAKQSETGVAGSPVAFANPDDQQQQSKKCPGDAVAHVAREVPAKVKRELVGTRLREVIRNLDVQ